MNAAPVTGRVRRIVRTAAVLVIGQALLGALIGWLTLRDSRPPVRGPGSAVVDELAAPPGAAPQRVTAEPLSPPAAVALPPLPPSRPARPRLDPPPVTGAATYRVAPTAKPPEPIALPPEPPPAVPPVVPSTRVTLPPGPPPGPPSPWPSPRPPEPSRTMSTSPAEPGPPVQEGAVVGARCWLPGARGRTARGTPVRCAAAWGSRPRWKIV